jgi:hypothetical protein
LFLYVVNVLVRNVLSSAPFFHQAP